MSDTQAIAARLTAIAERLEQEAIAYLSGTPARKRFYAKLMADFCLQRLEESENLSERRRVELVKLGDEFVRVVETLTQQVAELQQARTDDSLSPNSSASQGRSDESVFHRVVPSGRDSGQLKQAEQQRDAAHAALRTHGRHDYGCEGVNPRPRVCTCGLDAALAASAPQKEDR
jgi:hypothetical protein